MITELKLGKFSQWQENIACVPESLCPTGRARGAEGPLPQAGVWWSAPPESTDSYSAWTEHPLPGSPCSSYPESAHRHTQKHMNNLA